MSQFKVLAPDPDPALTGFPVEVSSHKSQDAALDAAKKKAATLKARASTVLIHEEGTQNVWSVQFHPEPPTATGAVDENGVPEYSFDPEFRVVFDGTEEDEGGALTGDRDVTDVKADDDEVSK